MKVSIPPALSRRAGSPARFRCAWNWASKRWRFPRPGMPRARWRPTPRRRESRRTSFCRATFPRPITWKCKAYGAHVTLVDGLISDCAPHGGGARAGGRLVRRQHAQRAVPHRRQEDHGLRSGRADGLGTARCDLLSHRRRRGDDRHVEGLRGDGAAGLDRQPAAQDDRGAGRGLPARRARVRRERAAQPVLGRRPHGGQRIARAQAAGRFSGAAKRCARAAARPSP